MLRLKRSVVAVIPLLLSLWPSGVVSAASTEVTCDSPIVTQDAFLASDLDCTLVIAGDGVTLDLRGHTVGGSGAGVGLSVGSNTGVTIRNGTVEDFFICVNVNSANGLILRDLVIRQCGSGVRLEASSSTIDRSEFTSIGGNAIGVLGDGNEILRNRIADGASAVSKGVLIAEGMDDNRVVGNEVSGQSVGIEAHVGSGSGNLIWRNSSFLNGTGIGVSQAGSAAVNVLLQNRAFLNQFGIVSNGWTDGGRNRASDNTTLDCSGVSC